MVKLLSYIEVALISMDRVQGWDSMLPILLLQKSWCFYSSHGPGTYVVRLFGLPTSCLVTVAIEIKVLLVLLLGVFCFASCVGH